MRIAALLGALAASTTCIAKPPDCTGMDDLPAVIGLAQLKTWGTVTTDTIVWKDATSIRVASEQVGADAWRQVHRVKWPLKNGRLVEMVIVSEASARDCSTGNVDILVVTKVATPR